KWWRLAVQVLAQLIGSDVRRLQSRFQQASDLGRRCLGRQRGAEKEENVRAGHLSERITQPELQDPRIARARDPSEQRGGETRGRVAQVHAVKRIEELRAEFDLVLLRIRHGEVLEQRKVEIYWR